MSALSTRPLPAATRASLTLFLGLRSTTALTLLGVGVTAGMAWLLGASTQASALNGFDVARPAPQIAVETLLLSQLFFAVAAAVLLCTEYATGTIAASLQAVPVRRRLLGARALVLAGVGAVAGAVSVGVGTAVAASAAGEFGAFTAGELARAGLGGAAYVAAVMLMCLGLAALCRSTAATITAAFVLLLGLAQVVPLLGAEWLARLADYLPAAAGSALAADPAGPAGPYGPGGAALVLLGWTALLLGAGFARLRLSDA